MAQRKRDYIGETEIDEELDAMPEEGAIEATVANLEDHGFDVVVADTPEEALEEVESHVPEGASVMNGHSTTLEEIGFTEYVEEGEHGWESLADEVWSIDDDEKRQAARREAQTADYFLGGINAVSETGELVAADLSGSRVGAYPFAASNVVIVSGVNKIVPTLDAAYDRLESVAYPLENERAQEAYGVESAVAKQVTLRRETEEDRTKVVLVKEKLGY
jgi:L-lactate utilization protein LutB